MLGPGVTILWSRLFCPCSSHPPCQVLVLCPSHTGCSGGQVEVPGRSRRLAERPVCLSPHLLHPVWRHGVRRNIHTYRCHVYIGKKEHSRHIEEEGCCQEVGWVGGEGRQAGFCPNCPSSPCLGSGGLGVMSHPVRPCLSGSNMVIERTHGVGVRSVWGLSVCLPCVCPPEP